MEKKGNGCLTGCLTALVGFILLLALLFWIVFCPHTRSSSDIDLYRALSGEIEGPNALDLSSSGIPCPYDLPQLGELEPYEDYRYLYTLLHQFIFESDAHCLIVRYDEAQYTAQKAALESRYLFHDAQTIQEFSHPMPWYEDSADGFDFLAIQGGDYPKKMFFLGFSDETQEVAIVYFYDSDLDCIDEPLEDFLKKNTGWEKIVE